MLQKKKLMKFKLRLRSTEASPVLPLNYFYPLSAAIYKILSRADGTYSSFLHEKGYGKGFKLFCFSQLTCSFQISGDRMMVNKPDVSLFITFHVPKAAESFVVGLFASASIDIADKYSRATFQVEGVEQVPDPLQQYGMNQMLMFEVKPLSPIVAGKPNDRGIYDFLSPEDPGFESVLLHNWRSKVAACWDEAAARDAILIMHPATTARVPKSRLITIKSGTAAESKIRGWLNFELQVAAEKRFLEVLFNAGVGVYNAQGMGCVQPTLISQK